MKVCRRGFALPLALFVCVCVAQARAGDDPAAGAFFETKVRPVLAENCFKCHGEQKQKGGLRLDSRSAILTGGDRGPAIVAGSPDTSLLVRAVRHADPDLQMPPKKKLSRTQIDQLVSWVRMGAPWPGSEKARPTSQRRREFRITEQDRAYWAFQPIRRPTVPEVCNRTWSSGAIDNFILARLEAKGVKPNSAATKRELIRRAYFDLIGLPPPPEEVTAFVNDRAPDAWERLVDRLLASPQYGERWGRHWLDVVRFAQSNGYERDDEKPFAWRYRDYVIDAFNSDKPYDRFIKDQLAGDELDEVTDEARIATGFYRLGVWDDEPDDARQAVFDELDEILTTVGQAFLGVTVNCARCHDHMFDPISQRDYYSLLSFIQNIKGYETAKLEPGSADFMPLIGGSKANGHGWALAVRERGGDAPKTHVLIRGSAGTPGDEVQPGFLTVLTSSAAKLPAARSNKSSCGRRRVLADWIASASNPLTARVLVNRLWQHHFGRGIVPTPNDFGKAGLPPSHPELLDWLAAEFQAGGWRIKRIHRLIMLSNAYRLSSKADRPEACAVDEGNELYWRQSLRRLEAEAIRDSALAVSGDLNSQMGGRGVFPPLGKEVIAGQSRPGFGWEIQRGRELDRRSVYLFIKRNLLVPVLENFDYSNTAQPLGSRPVTTVAPQALMLLNSDFMLERADRFADRIQQEAGTDPRNQVVRAYALALGRTPTAGEEKVATDYLAQQAGAVSKLRLPITITPQTPAAIFDGYLKQMQPADFVACPEGWNSQRGRWGNGYEGINTTDAATGPFVLYEPLTLLDGEIEGKIQLHATAQMGGILVRANPLANGMRGYAIDFDPRAGTAAIRRHDEKGVSVLAQAKCDVRTGGWYDFRIAVAGGRVQVWLREADSKPMPLLVEANDPQPIKESGRFGLRAWGAAVSARDLVVRIGAERKIVQGEREFQGSAAQRQALRALCLVMLNLNEFVYVD
jgi:mono/diheme cytochrome c family protein